MNRERPERAGPNRRRAAAAHAASADERILRIQPHTTLHARFTSKRPNYKIDAGTATEPPFSPCDRNDRGFDAGRASRGARMTMDRCSNEHHGVCNSTRA